MIDETRAVFGRVREQEDDDNDGCFNIKPKVCKSALDVYLQLHFLIESGSCSSSMVQPLLQQLRAPRAPVRGITLCGSPLIPAGPLRLSSSPVTPSFCLHRVPARYPGGTRCQVPWWLKRVREGTSGRKDILLAFQSPYCQAKKKFLQSLHSQLKSFSY